MMSNMLTNKAGDKVIAVVITGLHAQRQWMPCLFTDLLQQLRLQLFLKKVIRFALINQQWQLFSCRSDQGAAIPFQPALSVITQIGAERFLAPRHLAGGNNR